MRKRLVLVALLAAVTLMLGLVGCSSGDAAGGKAQEDVEGLPAWATIDAGPNVKVLTRAADADAVAAALPDRLPGAAVSVRRPGGGVRIEDTP